MNKSDCPRQQAFISDLDNLLVSYHVAYKDRSSVDEIEKYFDEYFKCEEDFINKWCPILIESEGDEE